MFRALFTGLVLSAGLLAGTAQAALPSGTLEFVQRTGTAAATDSIEVWVRFTATTSLIFSSNPLDGFNAEDLPTQGSYWDGNQVRLAPFVSYTNAYLNTSYTCNGSFWLCAEGSAYTFKFHTTSTNGKPSINFLDSFSLKAGESTEYLFGTFVPVGGSVAPGTYVFSNSGLTLNFQGLDAENRMLTASVTIGETCNNYLPSCSFERVVSAVPEPTSAALMLTGMGIVALGLRRRRR